jgi:hypothetical protein
MAQSRSVVTTVSRDDTTRLMDYLRVKGWDRFQHYKKKDGPVLWIKLYRTVLTDPEFQALSVPNRYRLIAIWLLAGDKGGLIPADPRFVARVIGVRAVDLDALVSSGWLERASAIGSTSDPEDIPF